MNLIRRIYYAVKNRVWNRLYPRLNRWLYSLFMRLPIDRNLILFESEGDFTDNAWVLYQYLRRLGRYRFVWFVAHPENFTNTQDTLFIDRFKPFRVRAYYYYARARINFWTHWTIKELRHREGQFVISLWHGVPVKDCRNPGRVYFDYSVTTGRGSINLVARTFRRAESFFLPLGYARNELLVKNNGTGHDNQIFGGRSFKKLILWMPTFRGSVNKSLNQVNVDTETGLPLFEDAESIVELNERLNQMNVVVMLKVHHLQSDKPVFHNEYSNLVVLKDEDIQSRKLQPYEIIGNTDALISDYSSIAIDYGILNKPMGFIHSDAEAYKESRGFLVDDIRTLLPGCYIYTKEEFYRFIEDVKDGKDFAAGQRIALMAKMHAQPIENTCERIAKHFGLV